MKLDEVLIIAMTLFGECRGESYEGKLAVASVIMNRAMERQISFKEVCLQPKQFSCWESSYGLLDIITVEQKAWGECVAIAKKMVDGTLKPCINANHYYNPVLASPRWGSQMTDVVDIGKHKFGRLT